MSREHAAGATEPEVPPFMRYVGFLADRDRMLLNMYYRNGMLQQDIAALVGRDVGSVSRRLKTLTNRLHDPLILGLIHAPPRVLSPQHRAIGLAYFLCNTPVSHIERAHHLPREKVKAVIEYLKVWARQR